MKKPDFKKLNLKCGLEIHQQLDTGKLFSDAPSFLRNDPSDYIIKRNLHAVAGETGKVDTAVKHESSLNKDFFYESYNDTTSLVELDEEPPRPINKEALEIVLQISLLLNCEIYPISQIMRKTVIDGSNTSGFQRTTLIAHSGFVETSSGKVGIESIAIEEDSARIISKEKEKSIFRLDRLGIPLVEITTKPEMYAPEQVKECALKIGELLRACKVKRGIGTIRQDLNISIKGHNRVEIKGFQDPKIMIPTIEFEIERQLQNIKKREKQGEVRKALFNGKTEFLRPMPGKARMYPETDLELLKISKETINSIRKNLPKLRKEIKSDLRKIGLKEELIKLILEGNLDEFLTLHKVYDKDANLVAKMITLWRTELSTKTRKSIDDIREILTERMLEEILEKIKKGRLDKSDTKEVMLRILNGLNLEEAIKIEKIDDNEIEKEIRNIMKEKPGLRPNAYMGIVMQRLQGKLDARKAMEIINKILN
jgi:Glu-tRNA(Gln) amidotransferase subunit E-like FAD-binding protein